MTDTNALATRGIHHLALNTEDMKMTIDYYVDVLGMKLVHAMKIPPGLGSGPNNRGNPPYENLRHYFFDMGNDSLLAFFEMPKGEKQVGDRDAIAAMQHVSFSMLPDAFEALKLRLKERDIDTIGPFGSFARRLFCLLFRSQWRSIGSVLPTGRRRDAQDRDGGDPNEVAGPRGIGDAD